MGYENIANYDLSFGEWGNRDDVPIERPVGWQPQTREQVPVTPVEFVLARWKANTEAAGVKMTEDDITRIRARGVLERTITVEKMIERYAAGETLPDYLSVLGSSTSEAGHE